MSTFPFALVVSQAALSDSFGPSFNGEEFEYASALPGAPTVEHDVPVRPPRVARARWALAESLRRAAEAVAPAPAR
ncbi:hypothetical protein [Dactylosporangium salmoneum]|uniref:Uncharacterized protein n=1 Tax=Dactylosporangium salmoneum TaxID=53361 RepID=A0ABP5V1I4_9ACTN